MAFFIPISTPNPHQSRHPREGLWTFAIALCITIAGALGFYHLYRKLVRSPAPDTQATD